jgi:hypothetical protein
VFVQVDASVEDCHVNRIFIYTSSTWTVLSPFYLSFTFCNLRVVSGEYIFVAQFQQLSSVYGIDKAMLNILVPFQFSLIPTI